jgi:hypothetical protein
MRMRLWLPKPSSCCAVLMTSLTEIASACTPSSTTSASQPRRQQPHRQQTARQLVPPDHAIVGIDPADSKQAAVVTDHDSRVIARRRVTARAWELGELLDWALAKANAAGFESVTVACRPGTGGGCWISWPGSGGRSSCFETRALPEQFEPRCRSHSALLSLVAAGYTASTPALTTG